MRSANPWCPNTMIPVMPPQQLSGSHVSHAESGVRRDVVVANSRQTDFATRAALPSGRPALRLAHHEIAENLHTCDGFQLFGIHKIRIKLDRIGLAEQLHQTVVLADQIIRQCSYAETPLTGAEQAEDVVDREIRLARARAIAPGLDQPTPILEMRRYLRIAEHDYAMTVEFFQRPRGAEVLDVFSRTVGVETHREQFALNEIRLGWLARADRDIGLAHRQIEFFVGDDQRYPDLRI